MLRKVLLWIPFAYLLALLVFVILLTDGIFKYLANPTPMHIDGANNAQPDNGLLYSILILLYIGLGLLTNILLKLSATGLTNIAFVLTYLLWLGAFVAPSVWVILQRLLFPVFER